MNCIRVTPLLAALVLVACGGSDDNTTAHRQAVDRAQAKETEARNLASATPCTGVGQCATLNFLSPSARCSDWTYHVYSTAAPSAAAASAAAADQNVLAQQAQALAPSGVVCAAVVTPPPALVCAANRCDAVVSVQ